jgi:hypothetical protein
MKVRDIFRHPIDRRIEEVIKVDLTDEEIVAGEIGEYVVTDHIRREFEKVLDAYQDSIARPTEAVTVWISGFFGSGKSSFAKVLGYLLENPQVMGKPAAERFFERVDDTKLRALLATCHTQAPALSVFVDLSTGRNVLREGEPVVLPLYRALLHRLGYARDFLLAELEFALEADGDLEAFEAAFETIPGGKGSWRQRRDIALARNEASHAMHLLRPETYPSPDSWVKGATEPAIDENWFVQRALELLDRRGRGAKRLVFIVDEVGQYVARDEKRLFDLMGLAHAVQKQKGRIWLVVTSQEKLDVIVDALEGRRVELARLRDRFPITVDLAPSDIEEVVARRVLEKSAEGADAIRRLFHAHRNQLSENVRLDSATRQRDLTESDFVRLYPLLPYQVQLFIDTVSLHRARGGVTAMMGGSNRTLIKLAQQLVVHRETRLGDQEVGALATAAMAYGVLESIIPTAWQAEIHRVAERHGREAIPTQVAKAVALVGGVQALKMEAQNIAVLLHPGVAAESLRDEVAKALQQLTQEEVLRHTDQGYKLQSPEEKDWERERRGIDLKPAGWVRLCGETAHQLLEGLIVDARRSFAVEVWVDGDRVLEGDLRVRIEQCPTDSIDEIRSRSREDANTDTLFWVFRPEDDTLETARELHRSREMLKRHEDRGSDATIAGLVGEERRRLERLEKQLRELVSRDLLGGIFFFRGVEEQPRGTNVRDALKTSLAEKIEKIFPRLTEFAAPAKRADALTVLRSDTLDGLPDYLGPDGVGIIQMTPDGPIIAFDTDPLATVLGKIQERTSYGNEATGKYLEERFGAPPYGAPVEAVQVFVAALIRAGRVEVISQGARIANPRDPRLDRVFGTLPGFRTASFVPQREVDPDMRARVAKRLQALSGERAPLAADQLARQVREFFRQDRERFARVIATLQALAIPAPEAVIRVKSMVDGFSGSSDEEVIKLCDEAWTDLVSGRALMHRLDQLLDEDGVELLRRARETLQRGAEGLGPQAERELTTLRDLMASAESLPEHVGEIRSLMQELELAWQNAWQEVADRLRREVRRADESLQARFGGRVPVAVLEEVLRPLRELAPPDGALPGDGPPPEALRARELGLESAIRRAEEQLEKAASEREVVKISIRQLWEGAVRSEEELETLLERIRQAAERALSEGKYFYLT